MYNINKTVLFWIVSLLFYNQIYALKPLVIHQNTIVRQIPTQKYLEKYKNDTEYAETQSDAIYYGDESLRHLQHKFPNLSIVVTNAEEYQIFGKSYKNTNNYSFLLVTKDHQVRILDAISFWETYMQFADCTDKRNEYCANYHLKIAEIKKNFVDKL